jgi:hypothetical protein
MSTRTPSRVAMVALAAALAGCGGGTTGPSEPAGRTRLGGGTFTVVGTVEANANGYNADVGTIPFNAGSAGTLEIVADWGSAANNIDIFLYLGPCSAEQARSGVCPVANRSTSETAKPESLTIIGVPAGSYSIGFANFGPTTETGSFEVFTVR